MSEAQATAGVTPAEVKELHDQRAILLVDVREPGEYAAERIHGALNYPLSTFDPVALPDDGRRAVVLHCGSGKRSATALDRCRAAGVNVGVHMAGGLSAWRAANLPTVRIDPATGAVVDVR